jgi:Mce-associated membrane protein
VTNPKNGKNRRHGLRTRRKGIAAVGVETDALVDPAVPEIDELQDLQDAGDGTESAQAPADMSCDDAEGALTEDGSSDDAENADDVEPQARKRRLKWSRLTAFGVLPVLALLLAVAVAFAKWQDESSRMSEVAAIESVAAAKDSTATLLSYKPETVEQQLNAARERLTGQFKDSYTQLIHDVVIPGSKKDHIAAAATVPAAASVSATPSHAVVLVFVDQTLTIGNDAPTDTASTVRVTLDKIGGRWLISSFDPV